MSPAVRAALDKFKIRGVFSVIRSSPDSDYEAERDAESTC
jgi:hypothetical protein